ncbi:hypothetical protein CVT24_007825, partial [Panaeolus cyanescens]
NSRPQKKRRKQRNYEKEQSEKPVLHSFSLQPLLKGLRIEDDVEEHSFEDLIGPILPELLEERENLELKLAEPDAHGQVLRPLRAGEREGLIEELAEKGVEHLSTKESLILRKLKLERQGKWISNLDGEKAVSPLGQLSPLNVSADALPHPEVLDALYSITTTKFDNSFLSRIHGSGEAIEQNLLAVDWQTKTPWMNLLSDIREHYSLAHPDRDQPIEQLGPISYVTLSAGLVPQVNDLLERCFWAGIDISDSLDYWPEKATVIAMYKKVVVGVAILSSPLETYITFLAVRAGWDKSQIARTMLFHLISMNPDKDITLHVSVNNSAMLLYNQFGFKAEEFVAGFYSQYLDPTSRASKNAFRLRLRHL